MRALVRGLALVGLLVGACTLGARDDDELSGEWGKGGTDGGSGTGGTGGTGGAVSCGKGTADCDGVASNACEVTTDKDLKNCGKCGNECPSSGGKTPTCIAGVCGLSNCEAPTADCDGNGSCETDLSGGDISNCGFCGNKCQADHAKMVCPGTCQMEDCESGFGNCDGQAGNGCEVALNTLTDCGTCGAACAIANATPSCATGTCEIATCTNGYQNCNNDVTDGCESFTNTDPANCGSCGKVCSANQTCQGGTCVTSTCPAPTADCDANPDCETNTSTSVAHCGFCNNACNLNNATPACANGTCAVASCKAGFADCDGLPANGCEVTLGTTTNCKACGDSCSGGAHVTSSSCTGSGCNIVCSPAYADCNNAASDGCEVLLATDVHHCGTCATDCTLSAPTGTQPACQSGSCSFNCATGTADCDGNTSCETNVLNDGLNCGICGRSCGTTSCVNGFCQPEQVVTATNVTSIDQNSSDPNSVVYGRNPGGVFRVDKNTLNSFTITTLRDAAWVDSAATYTYFVDPIDGVFRVNTTTGGNPGSLNGAATGGVALDFSSGAVWLTSTPGQAALRRIPPSGGIVTTADPATQGALGVDADASNVYYALPSLGEVRYVPVAGGAATALAFAQGEPSFVYEDTTHVYWTCTSAGVIRRATKPPAVTVSDFVTLQPGAYALAGTASDIYWAPKTTGSLWRASKSSGVWIKLVESVSGVKAISVDATHAYWVDGSGIRRVPK